MLHRLFPALLVAITILTGAPFNSTTAFAGEVRVFAAASLKNVLDTIARDWKAETGNDVLATYAASSALAKQIEAAAPADIFISADLKWMDYLAKADQIKEETRENLLGNSLVLVTSSDNPVDYQIDKGFDLASALGDGRLAVGAVDSVPAGRYAKAALVSLGSWDSVSGKLAESENVRSALLLVSRGEAPFGIVYKTDVKADPGVRIAGTFPEGSHDPIIYPVATLKASSNPLAEEFQKYVHSEKAQAEFTAEGFTILSVK